MANYPVLDASGAVIVANEKDPAYVASPYDDTDDYPVFDADGKYVLGGERIDVTFAGYGGFWTEDPAGTWARIGDPNWGQLRLAFSVDHSRYAFRFTVDGEPDFYRRNEADTAYEVLRRFSTGTYVYRFDLFATTQTQPLRFDRNGTDFTLSGMELYGLS